MMVKKFSMIDLDTKYDVICVRGAMNKMKKRYGNPNKRQILYTRI